MTGCTKEVIKYVDKVEYRYPPQNLLVIESKPEIAGRKTSHLLDWALSLEESLDKCHLQLQSVDFWIIENNGFENE